MTTETEEAAETVTVYRTDLAVLLAATPEDALGDEPAVMRAWKRLHRLAAEGNPAAGAQTCPCGEPKDAFGDCPGAVHGCDYHHEGDDPDGEPF